MTYMSLIEDNLLLIDTQNVCALQTSSFFLLYSKLFLCCEIPLDTGYMVRITEILTALEKFLQL